MAALWKYLVPTSLGASEDAEQLLRTHNDLLQKGYDDLEARYNALKAERSNMVQETMALRATLADDAATKTLITQLQTQLEVVQTSLQRRDKLLATINEQIQNHKGPITKVLKETIARSIYDEFSDLKSLPPSAPMSIS